MSSAVIVATKTYTGQSGNIGTTTLYTPTELGRFRLFFSYDKDPLTSGASIDVAWTTTLGDGHAFSGALTGQATLPIQFVADSSGPITFDVNGPASGSYNVYLVLERLPG